MPKIVERVRHSVTSIAHLPGEIRSIVQHVYADGLHVTFIAISISAGIALVSSYWASGGSLSRQQ
jgi:predicted RNA-binding protein with EMAP domain